MTLKHSLKTFLELSKSGIVTLVLLSVFSGYLIGHPSELAFSWGRLWATLVGILFLSSGSSALNQLQEKDIDGKMPRTAKRPLPSGQLTPQSVLAFVLITTLLGLGILAQLSFSLFALGLLALLLYNGLYTLWWKKTWAYAAVPGAIPGALPILMGYTAASGEVFTPGGIYLFFILFFWQMPHFWVLALRYTQDYEKGGFPTLPVSHGEGVTLFQITLWCLAYVGLTLIAPLFLQLGLIYGVASSLMSVKILIELYRFWKNPRDGRWLHFFLWINFSLILYLAAAALDLWSIYLPIPHLYR
ncbi:MAG: heme o synthase [Bdellovibrionia bacterium]